MLWRPNVAILAAVVWSGCITTPRLSTVDASDAPDGADGGAATTGEAGPLEDAPADDAAHLACVAACPAGGTCEGGTCVLACPGLPACVTGLTCPPGIACRITCQGNKSCGIVDCGTASTCKVECNGDTACKEVRSAATQTDIACTGRSACIDTRCDGDTCTVQCNGDACKPRDVKCCAAHCTVNGAPGACN